MLDLVLIAALFASLNAAPSKPEATKSALPAMADAAKAPAPRKAEGTKAPAKDDGPGAVAAPSPSKASPEAIADAVSALLGPCSPEMAGATVKAISVIDGKAMNEIIEKEKSTQAKADPAALFMVVEYKAGAQGGKDYRQVSTVYGLTPEQAQVLVGERMCVFGKL